MCIRDSRSDIPSLRAMMTDSMLTEIKSQLADRESHIGAQVNKTDVVLLEASLLGIEELDDAYMALSLIHIWSSAVVRGPRRSTRSFPWGWP